ncbi:MAG: hypothetical protein H6741_33690 [Alphaproteobacteria bacterium]|nr:hypothetical protein [Alphaproteobacteria bacterium]MCB9797670.1 hypothetical protein [Alphaproteobacteria bacterium]
MSTLPGWDPSLALPADSPREIPLPTPEAPDQPGPHPVTRLAASADGGLLAVVRSGIGEPYGFDLIVLTEGRVPWSDRTPCCDGALPSWAVRPAPRGGGALLVSLDSGAAVRLLTAGGKLRALEGADIDTRWAPDASWLGGSGGAWDAEGRPLAAYPLSKPADLVLPGPGPSQLTLVSEGLLHSWSGGEAAPAEGLWVLDRPPRDYQLLQDGHHPMWPSPDGQRLIVEDKRGTPTLLTPRAGLAEELPAPLRSAAWLDNDRVVLVVGHPERGTVPPHLLLLQPASGVAERITPAVPGTPSAVAAGGGALFVGTEEGRLFRVDGT